VTTTRIAPAGLVALALLAAPAEGQDRPAEEEMFGVPAAPAASQPAAPRLKLSEDTLKIGGMLYLRAQVYGYQGNPPSDWIFDSPNLVDVYLDVRPNDRVRGYVLGRLLFDPSASTGAPTVYGLSQQVYVGVVDQLWVRFDVERAAFVTAGRQHVKWGVGHFWNPTDYLHRLPRDPLSVFDARAGLTMVRLHVPWERTGWNFYGVVLLEGANPVSRLGDVGVGARAEVVLGTVEIGVDGVLQRGQGVTQQPILPPPLLYPAPATSPGPRLGVDFSAGIWELDLYGEAALKWGSELPRWRIVTPPDFSAGYPGAYESYDPGFSPQGVLGATWSWKYSDEDALTIGAEYFYNSLGYTDPAIYPALIFYRDYVPFYVGQQYAGLFLLLPKPGSWNDTNFTFSTLGNLSDRTFVSRLDYDVMLLTYLRLEAHVAVNYGPSGGEFRFAFDFPAIPNPVPPPNELGPYHYPPPTLDLGVGLRINL
jgi:hypothetical protein